MPGGGGGGKGGLLFSLGLFVFLVQTRDIYVIRNFSCPHFENYTLSSYKQHSFFK